MIGAIDIIQQNDTIVFSFHAQFNKCLIMFVASFPHHPQGRMEDITRTKGIKPVADKVEFLPVGPVVGIMLMDCPVGWANIMFVALKGRN